jgi:hypothetical protein
LTGVLTPMTIRIRNSSTRPGIDLIIMYVRSEIKISYLLIRKYFVIIKSENFSYIVPCRVFLL